MKFTKLALGLGIAITMVSCGATKTSKTTNTVAYKMISITDTIVAKKGEMSKEEIQKWPHMDILTDSVPGMSTAKAYDFIKDKKGQTVIVGIIDSGVDVKHEDLKDVVWVNPKEIAGNGKDDDGNGYVDDIHGWNFLGDIDKEDLEYIRIIKNPSITSKEEYERAKAFLEGKIKKATDEKIRYDGMLQAVTTAHEAFVKHFDKDSYTKEDVTAIKTEETTLLQNIAIATQMYSFGLPSLKDGIKELTKLVTGATELLNGDNLKHNYRKVLNDNEEDFSTKYYGDNNVIGKTDKELHGTHVAGIVAATRNNGIGINGIATNVQIMTVRAVPDGDEYDKDVALAIRYAVDNGAKVVNMSFGKAYSPHSDWVYDAIKYAAKHDVLLVKAAGNNGEDIDLPSYLHYPTDSPEIGSKEITDNVLTVGAITRHYDKGLVASFSNYGKTRVDVFAPGLEIYSTVPSNKYLSIQGTSMASPAVAGVAALVRSYYPNLTASQVKHIIMESGISYNAEVVVPHTTDEMKPFSEMSVNGKILNAYNALVMAEKMSKK
ncbi:MAG: S8 family peptidase [Flavobacteriaceae bacterium]|nr:S8 family peptidase [Flavobacteriaceae bacterium]